MTPGRRPIVTVLLPAFDAEPTLGVCLSSLLAQTERRWRCVLVDDGSRDGTLARARTFAARDARIEVVATEHRGLVAALATGLARSTTPFVARMDADDVMHPERLAAELAALDASPRLAAVGCHVRLFPAAPGMREYERWLNAIASPSQVRTEAFVECTVAHPTLVVRTAVLRALGYRDVGWPEDYDLVLRLLAAGHELGVVPRRLLAWRDGPSRLSRTDPRYALARFTACKAAFLATGLLAQDDTYVLWGHGATGRALRHALAAHGKRPSHVVEVHPRRLGQCIDGARVVDVDALRTLARRPVVVSVAGVAPRTRIRAAMTRMGFVETRDFVCAA